MKRLILLTATAMLLASSVGCGNYRPFLFNRGAYCGGCGCDGDAVYNGTVVPELGTTTILPPGPIETIQ